MIKIAAYKFTLLSAILILIALLLPSSSMPMLPSVIGIDKIAHFFLFLFFTLSYVLEFRHERGRLPGFLHAVLLVLFFIVMSETLQLFTASRHFELLDMAFDAAGAGAAFIATKVAFGSRKA